MVGSPSRLSVPAGLAAACLATFAAAQQQPEASQPPRRHAILAANVEAAVRQHGDEAAASIWVGDGTGAVLWSREANVLRPTASAIKVAYLVEFLAAHRDRLEAPPPTAAQVLALADHPAWLPFAAEHLPAIRSALGGASVQRIGELMIRGQGVSNTVYNAAANLVTADLGGPDGLTHKILCRYPGRPMLVNRYMLARRDATGDNLATAAGLGAVLAGLAGRALPGVDDRVIELARDTLRVEPDRRWGDHFAKGGSLDSQPVTRVVSGWYERDGHALVYVVMAECPTAGTGSELEATAARIRDMLVETFGPRSLWRGV